VCQRLRYTWPEDYRDEKALSAKNLRVFPFSHASAGDAANSVPDLCGGLREKLL